MLSICSNINNIVQTNIHFRGFNIIVSKNRDFACVNKYELTTAHVTVSLALFSTEEYTIIIRTSLVCYSGDYCLTVPVLGLLVSGTFEGQLGSARVALL